MDWVIELDAGIYRHVLAAIKREIEHPDRILASVGESLLPRHQERHLKGVDPDGVAWAPLAGSTLARKKTRRILFEHGDLLRFGYQVSAGVLRIGTNDKKAVWHHYGTGKYGTGNGPYVVKRKSGGSSMHPGVPVRRVVGWPQSDQDVTLRVMKEHLAAVARSRK